jgi:prephenate dehydrogenase
MTDLEATPRRRAQIVGLGLIGSSVALALSRAGWAVTGRDANQARAARALELGVVDALGSDDFAEIAFVATPVTAIPALVKEIFAASKRDDMIVTDVGGVKGPVAGAIDSPRFVGGHPMAGSEQEGPDGADPELFVGATWVLTPTPATDADAYSVVREIVMGFGADVVALEPARHDALVAVVSHVPHLTAANLMALAADASLEHAALLRLAAGGFRDMTRIAAGEPAIWPDIFRDNADAVLEVLDALLLRLREARDLIATENREGLLELLEYAKSARRNLPSRVVRPDAITECRITVTDRPGELAEVTAVLGGIGVNIWDIEIAHSAEGPRGVLVIAISTPDADVAREALITRGFRPSMRALA